MILAYKLDENFKDTVLLNVKSDCKTVKEVTFGDWTFFVNSENEINSINLRNASNYIKIADNQFWCLSDADIAAVKKAIEDSDLGIVLKLYPKFMYGKIVSRVNHLKSQKLFIVEINYNADSNVKLVTNTTDSLEGRVLVFAHLGASTASGLVVRDGEMMGVASPGMLVGYKTLGIDKEGLIFGHEDQIGQEFKF
ncbi:TyrS-associated PheT N-terminal domain-related protein TapR [Mycoplasma sp. Ms02]|uniref:TyrS-associated PheT N-terminal domain-related protein TapR n=1 Tax=Mycoplasma sp. Ms02 TaxID=353851 RepID=UPI001C88F8D0|nr:hypothetical protein [Mycoplasma sp. Ms02]QZE12218.1 hypothetical protein K4L35_02645 [Mycoplasma sp. Ms02]